MYADVDAVCALPVRQWLPPRDRAAEGLALEQEYNSMTWDRCSMLIGLENGLHFCQVSHLRLNPLHPSAWRTDYTSAR